MKGYAIFKKYFATLFTSKIYCFIMNHSHMIFHLLFSRQFLLYISYEKPIAKVMKKNNAYLSTDLTWISFFCVSSSSSVT